MSADADRFGRSARAHQRREIDGAAPAAELDGDARVLAGGGTERRAHRDAVAGLGVGRGEAGDEAGPPVGVIDDDDDPIVAEAAGIADRPRGGCDDTRARGGGKGQAARPDAGTAPAGAPTGSTGEPEAPAA